MKITKSRLKQIVKEELLAIHEQMVPFDETPEQKAAREARWAEEAEEREAGIETATMADIKRRSAAKAGPEVTGDVRAALKTPDIDLGKMIKQLQTVLSRAAKRAQGGKVTLPANQVPNIQRTLQKAMEIIQQTAPAGDEG